MAYIFFKNIAFQKYTYHMTIDDNLNTINRIIQ